MILIDDWVWILFNVSYIVMLCLLVYNLHRYRTINKALDKSINETLDKEYEISLLKKKVKDLEITDHDRNDWD